MESSPVSNSRLVLLLYSHSSLLSLSIGKGWLWLYGIRFGKCEGLLLSFLRFGKREMHLFFFVFAVRGNANIVLKVEEGPSNEKDGRPHFSFHNSSYTYMSCAGNCL